MRACRGFTGATATSACCRSRLHAQHQALVRQRPALCPRGPRLALLDRLLAKSPAERYLDRGSAADAGRARVGPARGLGVLTEVADSDESHVLRLVARRRAEGICVPRSAAVQAIFAEVLLRSLEQLP